jgi:hypothetical protein
LKELKDPFESSNRNLIQNKFNEVLEYSKNNPNDNERWKKWLQLRDECKIGNEYRYSESQIIYHYTTNKQYLIEIINKL